jgi:hypothetical protein
VWKDLDTDSALLSDAINGHISSVGDAPSPPVTEERLSFECTRCGRTMNATETVVTRTPGEVVYSCADDGARLVTIKPRDYYFTDGGLTIRVGDQDVDWWEYINAVDK